MCKTTASKGAPAGSVGDGAGRDEVRRRAVLEAARDEGTRFPAVTSGWTNDELEAWVKRDRVLRAAEAQGLALPPGSDGWARRDLEVFVRTGGAVAPSLPRVGTVDAGLKAPEAVSAAMQVGTRASKLGACTDAIVAAAAAIQGAGGAEWAGRFLGDARAVAALLGLVEVPPTTLDGAPDDAKELMNVLAGGAVWALVSAGGEEGEGDAPRGKAQAGAGREARRRAVVAEGGVARMQRLLEESTTWQGKAAAAAALGSLVVGLPAEADPEAWKAHPPFWTASNVLAVLPQLEEVLRCCPLPNPREAAAACVCNILGSRPAEVDREDPLLPGPPAEWCLDRLQAQLVARVSMSPARTAGHPEFGVAGTPGELRAEALALVAVARLRGNAGDVLQDLQAARRKLDTRRRRRAAPKELAWHAPTADEDGPDGERGDALEDDLDAVLRALPARELAS